MARDFDAARVMYTEARHVLRELGWEMQAALVSLSSGPIELLADDPARAERELRNDYEALREMDEQNFVTLTAVLLSEAVYRQRRFDEAERLVAFSRELAAPDDLAVQIILHSVAGKLAARAGDAAGGLASAAEALRLIETTDDPSGQADALLDLAEVRYLAGDTSGALDAVADARSRYTGKGNVAGVERAIAMAVRLTAGGDPLR
jgi:ATP/maltotriose-dependent transcriptional regulator MalT